MAHAIFPKACYFEVLCTEFILPLRYIHITTS